jgi:PEP-CTERM motif
MRVRETNTGPILQFAWLDEASPMFTTIDQVAITPAELANPQVELALSLNTAGSDVVTALVAFGSGNTLASFTGTLTPFASTSSGTDLFTASKDFAVAGFQGFTPAAIPEPSTWAMMLVGFAGLGFLAWRRRKRAAAA